MFADVMSEELSTDAGAAPDRAAEVAALAGQVQAARLHLEKARAELGELRDLLDALVAQSSAAKAPPLHT